MSIKNSAYGGMDWVDALSASKKTRAYDATSASGPEDISNALERTAEAAFHAPTSEVTSSAAIGEASREIQDKKASAQTSAEAKQIKDKLASRDIDPVKLGVASAEEWASSKDPKWTETVAKKAALAHEKQMKQAWQKDVMNPQELSAKPSIESRGGRIMSCTAAGEDSNSQVNRVPANANSVADPNRLDKLAAGSNEHDVSVAAAKQRDAERAGKRAKEAQAAMAEGALPTSEQLNSGKVLRSGGLDSEAFVHKVPKGQISIMDNLEALPPEKLKEKLASIFDKVPDTRTSIRQANEKRKEDIQDKRQQDKSWEKAEKGASTSEIQKKLMEMWMPNEPEK